ncbi:MAG: hypothetical protein RLZZ299_1691, partial [Pseudomonadota bacterium]
MLLLAALPLALAFDSEPQPAVFQTQVELFNNLARSSGPIPSGSPAAIDVGLTVNGGGAVRMAGEGVLSWPDGMTFGLVPTPEQGTFDVDVDVAAVVNLVYDLPIVGAGTFPFEVVEFPVNASTRFDPWALGQRVQASQALAPYDVFSLPLAFAIGEVVVSGSVTPVVTTGYVTTRWSADGNNVTQPNRTVTLAPDRLAQYPVNVAVAGRFDSTATLNLTGTIEGSVFGFDVGPFNYTYPFELSSETVDAEFPVRRLVFPLPMLAADLTAVEFGDVEVGRVDSVEINLDNDGAMPASGTITLEGGDGAFAVTPGTFEAPAGGSDVLVVTFAPLEDVPSEARLVITSNDPTAPTLTIPLTGNGGVDADGDGTIDGKVTSSDGCGCATGGSDRAALGALAMGAALLLRRSSRMGRRGAPPPQRLPRARKDGAPA